MQIAEFKLQTPKGNIYAKKWMPEELVDETPFILLHDSLGSVDLWRDFPEILAGATRRSVIAYDRLGFGKSDARTGLPSIKFITEEATEYFPHIKRALGISAYILFGHSVGGSMAVNIAARDADCRALITAASQAFVEAHTKQGIRDAKALFVRPGQLARLEKWHGQKAEWVLHAWTDVWLSPEFADWSLSDCVGDVQCPALAIHGENDEYGSVAFPEFIAGGVAGFSEMLILAECGHVPHKEKRAEVLDAIENFLDKQGI